MSIAPNNKRYFSDFLEYCRGNNDIPEFVCADRAATYKVLVENVVFENLKKAFPISFKRLGQSDWEKLTRSFFSVWNCPSPELWRMPNALVKYVENSEISHALSTPWLLDLLRFEWAEIEVFMMPDHTYSHSFGMVSDLWNESLLFNEESTFLELEYPVHRQMDRDLLNVRGRFYIVCFRHPESLQVVYIELAPFFLRLLQEISTTLDSASRCFARLVEEANFSTESEEHLRVETENFLRTAVLSGLVLGQVKF